jgi:hypothetical protein
MYGAVVPNWSASARSLRLQIDSPHAGSGCGARPLTAPLPRVLAQRPVEFDTITIQRNGSSQAQLPPDADSTSRPVSDPLPQLDNRATQPSLEIIVCR